MIKRECASCHFYEVSCSTINGITRYYRYGKCVKGKNKEVKATDSCAFYKFKEDAAEQYKPSFLLEANSMFQLFSIEEEVIKKYLVEIQNPLVFRINGEGEIVYKYDLRMLLDKVKENYSSTYFQSAEWFIKQKTEQYEKEISRLTKKKKELNLLR